MAAFGIKLVATARVLRRLDPCADMWRSAVARIMKTRRCRSLGDGSATPFATTVLEPTTYWKAFVGKLRLIDSRNVGTQHMDYRLRFFLFRLEEPLTTATLIVSAMRSESSTCQAQTESLQDGFRGLQCQPRSGRGNQGTLRAGRVSKEAQRRDQENSGAGYLW